MQKHLYHTHHAKKRMAQRDITKGDIDYVVQNGRWRRSGKGWVIALPFEHIPVQDKQKCGHRANIVVVLNDCWRNVIRTYWQRLRNPKPYVRERWPVHRYMQPDWLDWQ